MNTGQISFVGSSLHGFVGGKRISCSLRLGGSVPRGRYKLLPAVNDPIYGHMIMMVPVFQGESQMKYFPKVVPGQEVFKSWSDKDLSYKQGPSGSFMKDKDFKSWSGSFMRDKDFKSSSDKDFKSSSGSFMKDKDFKSWSGSFMRDKDFKSASDKDFKSSLGSFMKIDDVKGRPSGASYILCRRFMPGRNSIVVMSGFSDLVEALGANDIIVTA